MRWRRRRGGGAQRNRSDHQGVWIAQIPEVDKRLKVYGLEGLRIVDASIFPNVTSGSTHAAVLMVAEKGAYLILQDADLY
ncbi:Alcohol dehydrogenase [acceptor] [Pseudomonas sp. 22 E 5]|nr:Alcohol dehydrogenase [acceptor] [Pseudomonas sp. 22 E 5]